MIVLCIIITWSEVNSILPEFVQDRIWEMNGPVAQTLTLLRPDHEDIGTTSLVNKCGCRFRHSWTAKHHMICTVQKQ